MERDNLIRRKLRYLSVEFLVDLGIRKVRSLKFLVSLVTAIMTIWSLIFVHYLGQYIMLKMLSVPVTSYDARWFKVYLEYQFWHVR